MVVASAVSVKPQNVERLQDGRRQARARRLRTRTFLGHTFTAQDTEGIGIFPFPSGPCIGALFSGAAALDAHLPGRAMAGERRSLWKAATASSAMPLK